METQISHLSRRQFLRTAGGVGAMLAVQALPLAATPALAEQMRENPINADPDLHVVRRLTFGPTPELMEHVRDVGIDRFIEEQLAPEAIDDSAMDEMLSRFQTLHLSNAEIIKEYREQAGIVIGELQFATLLRAIASRRQLYEVMATNRITARVL